MQDLSGQTIKGYKLGARIAAGGFGAVYRAFQESVERDVAVKIILPELANQPDFIRRFEVEAHIVARLEHPYIVPLYDYWRDPDGAYLVMRWLRGGTLYDQLAKGPLGMQQVLQTLEQVGTALAAAHRRGVVHRDIKPSNVLLDEDDNAYLADFGIAKDLDSAPNPFQTVVGTVVGSPAYLSPEQIESHQITQQSDIYSLGVVLYEVLTGRLPFTSKTPYGFYTQHIHEPIPSLAQHRKDLPPALDAVIQRAAAKRPGDRYPDVLSLVDDFRRALATNVNTGATIISVPGRTAPSAVTPGARPPTPSRAPGGYTPTPNGGYDTVVYNPTEPALPIANPYKGLRAFQEADQDDFFGREGLVQHLLARMSKGGGMSQSLAVVGPSGSGKSSVVRAGVVPAIRRGAIPGSERWFVADMLPGPRPIEELANALLSVAVNRPPDLLAMLTSSEHGLSNALRLVLPPNTELLLVIDQFEEVFTLVEDEAARTHFLASLLAAAQSPNSGLRLLFTLRADFYDRPLLYPGFSELIRRRTEVVVPLAESELRDSITRPAALVGVRFDPDLVATIVRDVGEQPGALPLLQYMLTELFERRKGARITLDAYRAIGGVLGALARRADETYDELDLPAQNAAEQLFMRLVTLGEGAEDTRRRVPLAELASIGGDPQALDRVIKAYSQHRLLTFDHDPNTRAPTIEVAHEALIRSWGRLRKWLDGSRDDLRLQRRINAAALEWEAAGRDRSYLASGARLEQFDLGSRNTHIALNSEERAFLDASLEERDARLAEENERQRRELSLARRARNVLIALAAVLLVAAVVGIGLSVFAFGESARAQQNALDAEQSRQAAQRNADAAKGAEQLANKAAEEAKTSAEAAADLALVNGVRAALYNGDGDGAVSLALEAIGRAPQRDDAQVALADAAYTPGTVHLFRAHTGSVSSLALSADGKQALSGGEDKQLVLWDLASGEPIRTFAKAHDGAVLAVSLSADGATAVSGGSDAKVIIWDVASGTPRTVLAGPKNSVNAVALSPNGKQVLAAGGDKLLFLWDVATGALTRTFDAVHTQQVNSVVWTRDGTGAYSAGSDQTIIAWDVATGKLVRTFDPGHTQQINALALSPDGTRLLSAGADLTIGLWDTATGSAVEKPFASGHSRDIFALAWGPDGKSFASGARDTTIKLWDLGSSASLRRTLRGHGSTVRALAFLDDRFIVSGSEDHDLRSWDTRNGAVERTFAGHAKRIVRVVYTPDGKHAISASADTTLKEWDLATGAVLHTYEGLGDEVGTVAISKDGSFILAGGRNKLALFWDVKSGNVISAPLGPHLKEVSASAISPDGKQAVTGDGKGIAVVWNLRRSDAGITATRAFTFTGHADKVNYATYTPDGKYVLTASKDGTLLLWDPNAGQNKIIQTFKGHTGNVRSATFSPDGTEIVSAATDKTIILWNVATGKPVRTFRGHTGEIWQAIISPDGKTVLSAADDTSVVLWNKATGQPIRRYLAHTREARDVAFSADGNTFLSASNDNTLILWRVDSPAQLVEWAKQHRYHAALTCDQRALFDMTPGADCDAAP